LTFLDGREVIGASFRDHSRIVQIDVDAGELIGTFNFS